MNTFVYVLIEPVDIGKWFSSYVYESPELNTIEDFKDSGVSIVAETEDIPNEREQNLDGNIDLVLDGKGISDFVFNCKNSIRDENYKREVSSHEICILIWGFAIYFIDECSYY